MFKSKQSLLILLLAIALLLGVVSQIIYLHRTSELEFLSYIKESQLDHAQLVTARIQSFLQSYVRALESFSILVSSFDGTVLGNRQLVLSQLNEILGPYVERVSIHDAAGVPLYTVGDPVFGVDLGRREILGWVKQARDRRKVIVRPVVGDLAATGAEGTQGLAQGVTNRRERKPYQLLFVASLYQRPKGSMAAASREAFVGSIFLLVSVDDFLLTQLRIVDPTMKSHQLWLMDEDGTLLYQSQHPEMVHRNIFGADEECRRCHSSFGYIQEMLGKKEGTFSYQVKNAPRRLAAFSTVQLEGQSWTLAMTSDYDALTAFSKKSLRGHLTILSLFVIVLIGGSVLFQRNYRSITWAEKELKHLREKQALESQFLESQERYRMLVETMNDGLGVLDEQGMWVYVNDRLCEMTGYSKEEILGRPVGQFLDEGGQDTVRDQMAARREGSIASYEVTGIRKDGRRFFTLVSPQPIINGSGEFKGSFAVITDITEIKKTEEALRKSEQQLRDLSFQLLRAQEKERSRISRELHDELGQALAVLKLRLRFLEKNLSDDQGKLRTECEQSIKYIDQVIEEVRRLSRDLSPSILEDLGLSNAIQWLMGSFSQNNSLTITMDMKEIDLDHLFSQDEQIIIYRIFQEAFTNIGRHSQASHASVSMRKEERGLYVSMEDNGIGFDLVQTMMNKSGGKGLGLATMQERARMLGGILEIVSEKGRGTRIDVYFPTGKNQES